MNVCLRIFRLQKKQLRHDDVRHFVVNCGAQKNNPVLQQTTVNIHRPLFAAGFFDDKRYQRHSRAQIYFV